MPTDTEARRLLVLKPDPLGIPRNPLAIYLLLLTFLTGVMALTGTGGSAVLVSAHDWITWAWAAVLIHGSGATLTGMFWPGSVSTGLIFKRMGMFALMLGTFTYSLVVIATVGLGGLLAGGIVFGFGVACAVQYKVINDRIHAIIALTERKKS